MSKVLVVGGSGFIGSHTCAALQGAGHTVYSTHSRARRLTGLEGVIPVPCDLADEQATAGWPTDCASVVFLAQARHWRAFPQDADAVFAVNVAGLVRAVRHALKSGAERFIYASSGSIYSQTVRPAIESEMIDLQAQRNFYAASKLAAETLLGPYSRNLPVIQLRIFMPYGPGQSSDMLAPVIVDRVRNGQPVTLQGQDGIRANPIAVEEVAEAIRRSLGLSSSMTLNLAGPEETTLRQMAETIGRLIGRVPTFQMQENVAAPVIIADTTKLRNEFGWEPAIGIEQGFRQWLSRSAAAAA